MPRSGDGSATTLFTHVGNDIGVTHIVLRPGDGSATDSTRRGLLLRQAVQGAEPPDEIHRVNADH